MNLLKLIWSPIGWLVERIYELHLRITGKHDWYVTRPKVNFRPQNLPIYEQELSNADVEMLRDSAEFIIRHLEWHLEYTQQKLGYSQDLSQEALLAYKQRILVLNQELTMWRAIAEGREDEYGKQRTDSRER